MADPSENVLAVEMRMEVTRFAQFLTGGAGRFAYEVFWRGTLKLNVEGESLRDPVFFLV